MSWLDGHSLFWSGRCRKYMFGDDLFSKKYSPELESPFFFLCRVPIAIDLLLLKRQWKTFILWSVLALLLLLVRKFSETYISEIRSHFKYRAGYFTLFFFYPIFTPQVPLVAVDSYFYGKLVIAPLNILLYNVFTPHGPDLYGMF